MCFVVCGHPIRVPTEERLGTLMTFWQHGGEGGEGVPLAHDRALVGRDGIAVSKDLSSMHSAYVRFFTHHMS